MRRGFYHGVSFCGVCGAGLIVYAVTYGQAFPTASLDVQLDRDAALHRAEHLLQTFRVDFSHHHSVTAFAYFPETQMFLEKNCPPEQAAALMADEVSTWYWATRFFKPFAAEEYYVCLSPKGRLVSYVHKRAGQETATMCGEQDALAAASEFLAKHTAIVLNDYERIDALHDGGNAENGYCFEWRKTHFDCQGATYRVKAEVRGGRVSNFAEYLVLPEAWKQCQGKRLRQARNLLAIGNIFKYVVGVSAIFVFLIGLYRRDLRWPFTLILLAAVWGLLLLKWINGYTVLWFSYPTTVSPAAFIGNSLWALGKSLFSLVTLPFVWCCADFCGRHAFKNTLQISDLHTRDFWTSQGLVRAVLVGGALAVLTGALCNVFYIFVAWCGGWCPRNLPAVDALATPLPWIPVIGAGFVPAVQEEMFFRLFAISLIYIVTGSKWVAVCIPAVFWAFFHCNYPQEPFYVRLVEVSFVGLAFGAVMIRYGVVATLVAHYTFNSLNAGAFLIRSGNLYCTVTALLAVALPFAVCLAPAGVLVLKRKPSSRRMSSGLYTRQK